MNPTLTLAEIDAVAVPRGCAAGPRSSDSNLLMDSPWRTDLPLVERQRLWRERDLDLGRRMVAILAEREGWTPTQVAAAESVILDVPTNAVRRGRSYPVDALAVYREVARRGGVS